MKRAPSPRALIVVLCLALLHSSVLPVFGQKTASFDIRPRKSANHPVGIKSAGVDSGVVTTPYVSLIAVDHSYSENFNGLANQSGVDHPYTNGVTVPGWYSSRETYQASNGSVNMGSAISFGTGLATPSPERAFGSIASSGTGTIYYGMRLKNETGITITSLDISYTGEQWRKANNGTAHVLAFAYRQAVEITDLSGTYVNFGALDFTSPIFTATTAASLDGNQPANRRSITGTVNVTIPAGEEIMLRWADIDNSGDDHALAVDDLTIIPRGTVTEPPAIQFSSVSYDAFEGTYAAVYISRSGDLTETSSVDYSTSNGTAVAGSCAVGDDYIATSGTITFAPGESEKYFSITTCEDLASEITPETIGVSLSAPVGAVLGTRVGASVRIFDAVTQFRNALPITATAGNVGFSEINISGYTGTISSLRLTLFGVNASVADDLEVLLISPAGTGYLLMAGVGGAGSLSGTTFTLQNEAPETLPDSDPIVTGGHYRPATCSTVDTFPTPAPAGPYLLPLCDGTGVTLATAFRGENPNGTWSLYIRDKGSTPLFGDVSLSGGWGMQIFFPTAAEVELAGRVTTQTGAPIANAILNVHGGDLTEPVLVRTNPFGYYRFHGLTAGLTYVVTVGSKRYTFAEPARAITLGDTVENADFVSDQP